MLLQFAFLAGLIAQLWIITRSVRPILESLGIGFGLSVIGLIPSRYASRNRDYSFSRSLDYWPDFYLGFAFLSAMILLRYRGYRTQHRDAGLLLTFASLYWALSSYATGTKVGAVFLVAASLPLLWAQLPWAPQSRWFGLCNGLCGSALALYFTAELTWFAIVSGKTSAVSVESIATAGLLGLGVTYCGYQCLSFLRNVFKRHQPEPLLEATLPWQALLVGMLAAVAMTANESLQILPRGIAVAVLFGVGSLVLNRGAEK